MASMAEMRQQQPGLMGAGAFKDAFWGPSGWDELKKVMKGGTDFCKDLSATLQERVDLEQSYAKSLQKLATKLNKLCKEVSPPTAKDGSAKRGSVVDCSGDDARCRATVGACWSRVGEALDAEAEIHRSVANGFADEIIKPMRALVEAQCKAKKQIETTVEKRAKALNDRRSDESKAKKSAFTATKDSEKLEEQLKETQSGRSRSASISEKDIQKLEGKIKKLSDGVLKYENEYHEMGQKAEAARQDWESAVYKASAQLQMLEEERISQCSGFLRKYAGFVAAFVPAISQIQSGLEKLEISVNEDVQMTIDFKSTGANVPEQLLLCPYAVDLNNAMNLERRTMSLQRWVDLLEADVSRERKAKDGIHHLAQMMFKNSVSSQSVYSETPSYADMDARADVAQRLIQANATINFLEASQNRIQTAMAKLNRTTTGQHWTSQYMEHGKDKLGYQQTILRVPYNVLQEDSVYTDVPYANFSVGTGTLGRSSGSAVASAPSQSLLRRPLEESCAGAIDSMPVALGATGSTPGVIGFNVNATNFKNEGGTDLDEEFDLVDMSNVVGQAEAQFDYVANQEDELTIQAGDLISVYDKTDDGWWQGELRGKWGLFPASYVKMI